MWAGTDFFAAGGSGSTGTGTGSGSAMLRTIPGSGSGSASAGSGTPSSDVVPVASIALEEGYNRGWTCDATLKFRGATFLGLGAMFGSVIARRVVPGNSVMLRQVLATDGKNPYDGAVIRTWPCVITGVTPAEDDDAMVGAALVQLVDPVTYLASRPLWVAYRGVSLAEVLGGALSIAAGGDGRPTLRPNMPNMPDVQIVVAYRKELDFLEYAIAAGQPFGEWLEELLGLLGVRLEMLASPTGKLVLELTDQAPAAETLPMIRLSADHVFGQKVEPSPTNMEVISIASHPGTPWRGGVVDDINLGIYRRFGRNGPVGYYDSGVGIGIDEAARRSTFPTVTAATESLCLVGISRQPGFRPGRRVMFHEKYLTNRVWHIAKVLHTVIEGAYANTALLMVWTPTLPWHPPRPAETSPRHISAIVDGGSEFDYLEPIGRDRLGRIPVTFAFVPIVEEAHLERAFEAADSDNDGLVELSDFTATETTSYGSATASWEKKASDYRKGVYREPWPDKKDSELTSTELAARRSKAAQRTAALRYIAYKRAKSLEGLDRDHDGYVTARDYMLGEYLAGVMKNDAQRKEIAAQWAARKAGTLAASYPNLPQWKIDQIDHYGRLFDSGPLRMPSRSSATPANGGTATPAYGGTTPSAGVGTGAGSGSTNRRVPQLTAYEYRLIRRDVATEPQKWPPRIPLTLIEPMAGALHGFTPAHRHGDICRVVVHNPLWAEILGFQYRGDRQITPGTTIQTAGLLAEHDHAYAWSGIMFAESKQLEGSSSGLVPAGSGSGSGSSSGAGSSSASA